MATETYDAVGYGNTAAAVFSACAKVAGGAQKVALVTPQTHFGGILSNGLGSIDIGRYGTRGIGFMSDEFFRRLASYSGSRLRLGRNSPSNIEMALNSMLKDYGVIARTGYQLASVLKTGTVLNSFTATDGTVFAGSQFSDETEDGDLAKAAGVTMRVGRESQAEYGESLAGFYPNPDTFVPLDCYDGNGNIIYGFSPYPATAFGDADGGVQSYGFRLCITQDVENKKAWPKPAGYDPSLFEYLRRINERNLQNPSWKPFGAAACVDGKFDMNADFGIPRQWEWPDATPARRAEILQLIYAEQAGWLWFLANDASVHPDVRSYVNSWGPCLDELVDSSVSASGWPSEPYVRTSRRMVGQYVQKQSDVQVNITKTDSIAVGFYSIDIHINRRLAYQKDGVPGFIIDSVGYSEDGDARQVQPYQIPLRCILPQAADCSNLVVGVASSYSSVAMGSGRIDIHKANQAAAGGFLQGRCIATGQALNAYSVPDLQSRLVALGQVISYTPPS
jgi:hypothetical protein